MNFKIGNNLLKNNNFLFNSLIFSTLLFNFRIPIVFFSILILLLLLINNFKKIELSKTIFLSLLILVSYISVLYLFNSYNFLDYISSIKYWFSFLFIILIFKLFNYQFSLNIFIFRFLFLLFLIEFLIFNFLPDQSFIFKTENSVNQWFGFHRIIGFARNTSISGSSFVILFIYFYQCKIIKSIDWLFLLLGLIMIFSSTSFVLISLFSIYYLFQSSKKFKFLKFKKVIIVSTFILLILNMPIRQHSSIDELKIINYQKISKSYYLDNAVYKFNIFLCNVLEISPIFKYNFSDYSLKKSNICFTSVKLNPIVGTSFDGDILIGGDFGWMSFFQNFGILGFLILFSSLAFYKKNNHFYLVLLILLCSFHYFTLSILFTQFFLAMLLNQPKIKKNEKFSNIYNVR